MERNNWFVILWCIIFQVGWGLQFGYGQTEIVKRECEKYYEEPDINNFKITIPHDDLAVLIKEACPCKEKFQNDPERYYPCDSAYGIAGFCFTPIWCITDNGRDSTFKTTGLRIMVALWKRNVPNNAAADEVVFAGFKDNNLELVDALSSLGNDLSSVNSYIMEIPADSCATDVMEFERRLYPSGLLDNFDNTQEFDFVFLAYERYLDLVRQSEGFKKGTPNQKGIVIQRSFSNQSSLDKKDNPKFDNYRTLWFHPDPQTLLEAVVTRAAFEYEQGKHCPPYWKNTISNCSGNTLAITNSLTSMIAGEMQVLRPLYISDTELVDGGGGNIGSPSIIDIKPEPRNFVGLSIHGGYTFSTDTLSAFSGNGPLFEVGFEFGFKNGDNRFALEALYGWYQISPDVNINGLNLLLKSYLVRREKFRWFLSPGVGTYDIGSGTKIGVTVQSGFDIPFFLDGLYLSAGAQYQSFRLINNANSRAAIWGAKGGLRYYF